MEQQVKKMVGIQAITEGDREWVREFLWQQAGHTRMVSRGVLHQCDELPGVNLQSSP